MDLWQIYLIFCKIGAVTFGGGYAMLPLFQDELVTRAALLTPEEFANMAALAQLTPGAIGLNMATYIGFTHFGFPGALVATAGLITPPMFIVTAIAFFFLHFSRNRLVQAGLAGIRPVTLGLIAAAAVFFLEISVFTGPVPWGSWWRRLLGENPGPSAFGVNGWGLSIFAVSLAASVKFKLSAPLVLLLSAALGLAGHWLF